MGKHFGNLQRLKGVYYYTLSPMDLHPMIMMRAGFANAVRKSLSAIALCFVPVSISAYVYYWSMTTYHRLQRKNPDDYKDDE